MCDIMVSHSQWFLLETQYLRPHWTSHTIYLPPCDFLISQTPPQVYIFIQHPHTHAYVDAHVHLHMHRHVVHTYTSTAPHTHGHTNTLIKTEQSSNLSDTDQWHFLLRSEHWISTQLTEHRTLYFLWNPRVSPHTKSAVWRNWLPQLDVWAYTSSVESTYLKKSQANLPREYIFFFYDLNYSAPDLCAYCVLYYVQMWDAKLWTVIMFIIMKYKFASVHCN